MRGRKELRTDRPTLLLAGAGHAHLEVLRRFARAPLRGVDVALVSPSPLHLYSAMVPGYLRGAWPIEALAVDVRPLCAAAGARFVEATVGAVDVAGRRCATSAGAIDFALLSLDVGSAPAGLDDVEGARDHAIALRPVREAVALRQRLDALLARRGVEPRRVFVVGAGAAGIEVALAAARRARDGGRAAAVTLVERAAHVLPEHDARARALAARVLAGGGVAVRTGTMVRRVEADAIELVSASGHAFGDAAVDGERLPADLVVWLAGAAPPPLLATVGLPRDDAGWLRVDATLRAPGAAPVWGAGDCVSLDGRGALPKSGVVAVRMGPVLARSLRAAITGERPATYVPQPAFLSLLDTADGRALRLGRGSPAWGRRWWWLKRAIDARHVRALRSRRRARG